VSAFTQVISLYLRSKTDESETDPCKEYDYVTMLNNVLPPKVRVVAWANVGLEFDARFQVLYRSYKYYFPKCDLDIDLMRNSLHRFIGTSNFRAFCKADRTLENPNYERTISYLSIDLVCEDVHDNNLSMYCISVLGHAFLWHQIRNMVSVIFRIGLGLESPKIISDLLEAGVKYNYDLASEIPLVLFECEFENIDWNESKVDLSQLWFESSVKTTLIRQLMSKDLLSVRNIGVLCDTKKQSIMSRPFIS
jgi:tRNA pseudouridine38/39 synthase